MKTKTPDHIADSPTSVSRKSEHDHGFAPSFLPHWMQERWTVLTVAVAGLALGIGFFGEKFFGLPPSTVLAFYILPTWRVAMMSPVQPYPRSSVGSSTLIC